MGEVLNGRIYGRNKGKIYVWNMWGDTVTLFPCILCHCGHIKQICGAQRNIIQFQVFLSMAGGWSWKIFKFPSNPGHSMTMILLLLLAVLPPWQGGLHPVWAHSSAPSWVPRALSAHLKQGLRRKDSFFSFVSSQSERKREGRGEILLHSSQLLPHTPLNIIPEAERAHTESSAPLLPLLEDVGVYMAHSEVLLCHVKG